MQASIARVSPHDADAMPGFEALLERTADVLRPLMLRPPPALGSHHPGDLLELAARGRPRARALGRRDVSDLFRVLTMSVGDLLDDWFETDALKGSYASTGVVGVWAGPAHARHRVQPAAPRARRARRRLGRLGPRAGRHGRDLRGDRRERARRRRRDPHRGAASPRSTSPAAAVDRRDARVRRDSCTRRLVLSGAHPRTTCSTSSAPSTSPTRSPRTCAATASRGGSVKINCDPVRAAALRAALRGRERGAAAHEPRDLPVDRLPRARLAGRHARRAGRAALHRGRGADRASTRR